MTGELWTVAMVSATIAAGKFVIYNKLYKLIHKTRYRNHLKYPRNEKYMQARNKVFQTLLESKKRKPTIFDQMGHRQANTSRQKRKTKLYSVPRGKANDYERSFKELS